jgi:hypothetical protein
LQSRRLYDLLGMADLTNIMLVQKLSKTNKRTLVYDVVLLRSDQQHVSANTIIQIHLYSFYSFLWGVSPASEFYVATFRKSLFCLHRWCGQKESKMGQTEYSETSPHKIQKPGNNPKERIRHSQHGGSLKSKTLMFIVCRDHSTVTVTFFRLKYP